MKKRLLSDLTTLRLGGPARVIEPQSEAEVLAVVREAAAANTALTVLGGGSNVVCPDAGVSGIVLHFTEALGETSLRDDGETVLVTLGAGASWSSWVEQSLQLGFAGHECLGGIPGLVGATPIQNVGAYGVEVSDSIEVVRVYDQQLGAIRTLSHAECMFTYRHSRLKQQAARYIVLAVTFRLQRAKHSVPLRYAELCAALQIAPGCTAPAIEVHSTVVRLRQAKGMLLDAQDPESVSAGSFFTNPIVTAAVADGVFERAGKPASMPRFGEGDKTKLAAAWLIELAGFVKGTRRGPVGISSKHALALVNYGGATTRELLEFADEIRAGVAAKFAVTLEQEPVLFK